MNKDRFNKILNNAVAQRSERQAGCGRHGVSYTVYHRINGGEWRPFASNNQSGVDNNWLILSLQIGQPNKLDFKITGNGRRATGKWDLGLYGWEPSGAHSESSYSLNGQEIKVPEGYMYDHSARILPPAEAAGISNETIISFDLNVTEQISSFVYIIKESLIQTEESSNVSKILTDENIEGCSLRSQYAVTFGKQ